MSERGKYIVIEGNDGTGKSTQVERLEMRLAAAGIHCSRIHEPDGPPTASRLRDIIKDGRLERDPWTNVLLFTASRRISWLQAMKPALDNGEYVVAARNWFSTIAYQGYGQGIELEKIERFTKDNIAEDYLSPDLTLILSLQDEERSGRITAREELNRPDTFESLPPDFQARVNTGYIQFAQDRGIEIIDASQSIEVVEEEIWSRVKNLMKEGEDETIS